MKILGKYLFILFFLMLLYTGVYADEGISSAVVSKGLDTVWVIFAAILVFFMQAGYVVHEKVKLETVKYLSWIFPNVSAYEAEKREAGQ